MRPRGANGECGIAPAPDHPKPPKAQNLRAPPGHGAPGNARHCRSGRLGNDGVSDPRTPHLPMAPTPSDW
ncbi:hypothetical protein N7486_009538 [Penicillium sp. IBT 16267x]|nr:hypothetical protein N7486_009538 [Penicillium sp. IBT 16267x]